MAMNYVFRCYVEKKPGFDVEAQKVFHELRDQLGIQGLTGLRLLNRYDAEGLDYPVYLSAKNTVFAEPQVDEIYDEALPKLEGEHHILAVEALPGQYDQRADSCAQCIQLLTGGERPLAAAAAVYILLGEMSDGELERVKGYTMKEDSGRGWRRVVPSPSPKRIVEIGTIKTLWDTTVSIACGGGGIPVVEREDGSLEGVAAVIDKDLAACRLAQEMEADILMILTEVPAVAIHFGKPNQENLGHVTAGQLEEYAAQGQFGAGSMLPKVQAAIDFVRSAPNRTALITSLDLGLEALSGRAGTKVTA